MKDMRNIYVYKIFPIFVLGKMGIVAAIYRVFIG